MQNEKKTKRDQQTDGWMDRPTNQPNDGQSQSYSRVQATKKHAFTKKAFIQRGCLVLF